MFLDIFRHLPVGAVLEDSVFVVHGGLPTRNGGKVSLEELNAIDRTIEPQPGDLLFELVRLSSLDYRFTRPYIALERSGNP